MSNDQPVIIIRRPRRGQFRVLEGGPNPDFFRPPIELPALAPRGGGHRARWRGRVALLTGQAPAGRAGYSARTMMSTKTPKIETGLEPHDSPQVKWLDAAGEPVASLEVWWERGGNRDGVDQLGWCGPPTGTDLTDEEFDAGLALAALVLSRLPEGATQEQIDAAAETAARLRGKFPQGPVTSPYACYQCWLHSDDRDVERLLGAFTVLAPLSESEVARLLAEPARDFGCLVSEAHRLLARLVTALVYGADERDQAEAAARALFSGGLRGLSPALLDEVLAAVPSSSAPRDRLAGDGLPLIDVLVELTGLVKSKREAREHLDKGAVLLNGERVGINDRLTADRLLHGSIAALRRGKTSWHVVRFTQGGPTQAE